ncbi:MAG: aldehyde ferredoxin oxidoreductase family protein, partial [bacterium]
LRVNLTTGELKKELTPAKIRKDYIGGRGLGARILWDEVPAGADPLGPENKLIITTGPLAGLYIPGASKTTFVSKSPATGGYGDSSVGGHLASELKYAALDAIVIEGSSEKPVYLYINDDKIELRDAMEYLNCGCLETEQKLRAELGSDFQVATIGPAGENMVKYASINHDYGRQAGRTGMGAIMGSKNLKAICIKGTNSPEVADMDKLVEVIRLMYKKTEELGIENWQEYGTPEVVEFSDSIGTLPTRNFSEGVYESSNKINATTMKEKLTKNSKACTSCSLACGKYAYSSRYDVYIEGPEYETLVLLGSNCGLSDIDDVLYANYLCDDLGMDTISAGNVIGFVMDCFERGLIDKKSFEFEIKFGEAEKIFELLKMIAAREGVGKLLSKGVKEVAAAFGPETHKYAMEIKGLEISGYETRNSTAMLLAYMTSEIGATHTKAFMIPLDQEMGPGEINTKKVKAVIDTQHSDPVLDCLGGCHFQEALDLDLYSEALTAATGQDYTAKDLKKVGERVWNLTRLFLKREESDFDRSWDLPPARYAEEKLTKGPGEGRSVSLEDQNKLLDIYYELRGWDEKGIPTREKLQELGLEKEIEVL